MNSTCKWYHTVLVFLWSISLNIMLSRFIHVVTNGIISFLKNSWIVFHFIHSSHFFHSFIHQLDTWVVCIFWLLWIMLQWTAAVQIALWDTDSASFRYKPRSVIAGSDGSSVLNFFEKLNRALKTDFITLKI